MKRNRIALLAASTVLAVLLTTTDFIKIDASSFPRRMFTRFTPEMRATMAARLRHAAQVSWSKVRRFDEFARAKASAAEKEFWQQSPFIGAHLFFAYQAIILNLGMNDTHPCTDPEIINLVHTIAQDLGITEPIKVFIKKGPWPFDAAVTSTLLNDEINLIVHSEKIGNDYSLWVYLIAHELGHFLQFRKSPDSYHPPLDRFLSSEIFLLNLKKLETGADANAAGYVDCQDCLRRIQDIKRPGSFFLQQKGYFGAEDFQPYLERAVEQDWRCSAHEDMHKLHFAEMALNLTAGLDYPFTPTLKTPKFKMHDYLPKRDRSGYLPTPTPQELFPWLAQPAQEKEMFADLQHPATSKSSRE